MIKSINLRKWREQAGLNQTDLAKLFTKYTGEKKKQVDISRIEREYVTLSYPDAVVFVKILNDLGVRNSDGSELKLEDLAEISEVMTNPAMQPA